MSHGKFIKKNIRLWPISYWPVQLVCPGRLCRICWEWSEPWWGNLESRPVAAHLSVVPRRTHGHYPPRSMCCMGSGAYKCEKWINEFWYAKKVQQFFSIKEPSTNGWLGWVRPRNCHSRTKHKAIREVFSQSVAVPRSDPNQTNELFLF